jgi:hypothetical protein
MDVDHEQDPGCIEGKQKRVFTIRTVCRDPRKAEVLLNSALHDVQREIELRSRIPPYLLRDAGPPAPLRIVRPFPRNEQSRIRQGDLVPTCQRPINTHLAVLDLAQLPAPLTRHTRRMLALLRMATLVDDQKRVVMSAQ